MKAQRLVVVLMIMNLTSCMKKDYVLKENHHLESAFLLNSSRTFRGYFYVGSDESFHYFYENWSLKKDKYFKISKNNLHVHYSFNKDEDAIPITLLEKHEATVFADNEHYTIYILKE